MIWQEWWAWVAGGLVLAVAEMLIPGFVLLGFAGGAVVTGILLALGVIGSSLPVALVVFGFASLACWLGLRYGFGRRDGEQARIIHHDIND